MHMLPVPVRVAMGYRMVSMPVLHMSCGVLLFRVHGVVHDNYPGKEREADDAYTARQTVGHVVCVHVMLRCVCRVVVVCTDRERGQV